MRTRYFIFLFSLFIFSLSGTRTGAAGLDGSAAAPNVGTPGPSVGAAGPDENAADPPEDPGGDSTVSPDVPPVGIGSDFLQPLLAEYQGDSARRQTDSEIFRFALVAFLALWAGRSITQRRCR